MKPIEFPEADCTLGPPPDMTSEECGPLYIFRDLQNGTCISLWQMTWRERFRALFYGKIWLGVRSGARTQPPVWLDVRRTVFEKPAATEQSA